MSISVAAMDSYRVFQRDTQDGNPPGSTTYGKGWASISFAVTSDQAGPASYRIVDAQDPGRVIQDWTATDQALVAGGTAPITLKIPASTDCYTVQFARSADLGVSGASTPFFVGNVDAAAGQSKATGFFSPYAYSDQDPVAQPEQYVPFSFSSRVASNSAPGASSMSWLPPGNVDRAGGAVVSTFPAEFLRMRQQELGVACALVGADAPGSSISSWQPGTQNFGKLETAIRLAGGKVSTFIWNQGDADWNPAGVASYQQQFQSLVSGLDAVVQGPYKVAAFDYMWIGGDQPGRYVQLEGIAKAAVAGAHGGSYSIGVDPGSHYFGGHPTMIARMLAADDVFRQIDALDDPAHADKGPSLTGAATLRGNTVDLAVAQDKGSALAGLISDEAGTKAVFGAATDSWLTSLFSVYQHGYTDNLHRIAVSAVDIVGPTDIRLTLARAPAGQVDVWYYADYGAGGFGSPNAVIQDNVTDGGLPFGHDLQVPMTPVVATQSAAADAAPRSVQDVIKVTLSGHHWQGDPQFFLSVDSIDQSGLAQVVEADASAGNTEVLTFTGNYGPGPHAVCIGFNNPANDFGGNVRDFSVSGFTFDGVQSSFPSDDFRYGQNYTATVEAPSGYVAPAGNAGFTVTNPAAPTDGLVLYVSGDVSRGTVPQYTVSVDGVQVGGTRTASASWSLGNSEAVQVPGRLSAGHHAVVVSLVNGSAPYTPGPGLSVDAASYDGQALPVPALAMLQAGSTATLDVVPAGGRVPGLVLSMSEDAYKGDAQYSVTLDGVPYGTPGYVSADHASGSRQQVTLGTLASGVHEVVVKLANDASGGPGLDRNLYLDGASYDGGLVAAAHGVMDSGTDYARFLVDVPGTAAAAPRPVLDVQQGDIRLVSGQAVSFAIPASSFHDPAGSSLAYSASLEGGAALPPWLAFDPATRSFSGTLPSGRSQARIVVAASNAAGAAAAEAFTIYGAPGKPILAAQQDDVRVRSGKAFSVTLPAGSFTDPAGGTVAYAVSSLDGSALPGWVNFDPASRVLSGTAQATASPLGILVTATTGGGGSAAEAFKVYTLPPPAKLLSQQGDIRVQAGQAFSVTLPAASFSDPDGGNARLSASSGDGSALPPWASFDAASGTLAGTAPSVTSDLKVVVTGTAAAGGTAAEAFHVYVQAPAPTLAAQAPDQFLRAGSPFSFVLPKGGFAAPDGSAVALAARQDNLQPLPSWLSFDAASQTFSGVAQAAGSVSGIRIDATTVAGGRAAEAFHVYAA